MHRAMRPGPRAALATLALLAAACAPGGPDAPTTLTPTGTPAGPSTAGGGPAAAGSPGFALARSLEAFVLDFPDEAAAVALVQTIARDGSPEHLPYVVDLLRLFGSIEIRTAGAEAAARLAGVEIHPDDAWFDLATWLHVEQPVPADGYRAWKAALYGWIDEAFTPLIASIEDPVTVALLQWGGVRRGGIPELNDPRTLEGGRAEYLDRDELVFGAVIEGEARAYPFRVLNHHELANDQLGGQPVALANCTLCRSGILYSREMEGQTLDFQTSGLLLNSNKVMVDLQTESLWEQLTGRAFAGPLAGERLRALAVTVTTWEEWVAEYPSTTVVDIPLGFSYSYEPGDAYRAYYATDALLFPALASPGFDPKAEVATLEHADGALAVEVDALRAEGPRTFEVGGDPVVAVPTAAGARFYAGALDGRTVRDAGEDALTLDDGTRLERLVSGQSFWFAWYAAHPDSQRWPQR